MTLSFFLPLHKREVVQKEREREDSSKVQWQLPLPQMVVSDSYSQVYTHTHTMLKTRYTLRFQWTRSVASVEVRTLRALVCVDARIRRSGHVKRSFMPGMLASAAFLVASCPFASQGHHENADVQRCPSKDAAGHSHRSRFMKI